MAWRQQLGVCRHMKKEMKPEGTIKSTKIERKCGDWLVPVSRNKGVKAEKL